MSVLDGHHESGIAVFVYGLDEDGEVVSAALRVPPWPLLASELDASDATELVELWLSEDPQVPGVNGLPVTARAIAHAWAQRTGGTTSRRMREAMHVLTTVRDPQRPASGRLRLAQSTERSLLLDWMRDFAVEAGVMGGAQADAMVDTRLDRQHLFVWEDGEPVSMIGISPAVAGVVRIGPVYTPPEHRRRGFAGSAVAATSRRALEQGACQCLLFTDLANPTSNKIYADVGYRRFADWEEHAFHRAAPETTRMADTGSRTC
jgi:predicted GNAT family acetyltransferase